MEVDETPIVKTIKNAKGRNAGLALAREKNTAQRRAVKNVMEAHKAVQKVKTLSEKAGTAYTISKQKAAAAGMALPEVPPIENRMGDMLAAMQGEIERLKAITAAVPPEPEPKKKRVVKSKATKEPEPPKLRKEDMIEHVEERPPPPPVLSAREQRAQNMKDDQARNMDALRRAMGRF